MIRYAIRAIYETEAEPEARREEKAAAKRRRSAGKETE